MRRQFNLETQEWEEDNEPELDALGYLQQIYRDPGQPDQRRFKAACAALPFERPKLEAIANFNGGDDFSGRLERAVEESNRVRETRMIEAKATSNGHLGPTPEEVSASAMKRSFSPLRRRF